MCACAHLVLDDGMDEVLMHACVCVCAHLVLDDGMDEVLMHVCVCPPCP